MTTDTHAILGTHRSEVLLGTDENDRIFGGCGDDWIFGGDGNDLVAGGRGNDSVAGGYGNDTVAGGRGSNELAGGWGADRFVIQSDGFQRIIDFDYYESDKLVIHDENFLEADGLANLDMLMVQDFGYDLVVLGLVDEEYQVLARIDWGAGLTLLDILDPSLLGDVPGDTSSTETLNLGQTVSGEFEYFYDSDWYRFEAEAGKFYAFSYTPDPTADDPSSYGYAELYDADGYYLSPTYVEYSDEAVTLYYQSDFAQNLYFSVTDDSYDLGAYLVSVEEAVNTDTVPNNPSTTAELTLAAAVTGEFDYYTDSDWYRFEAEAGAFYTFTYAPDAMSSAPSSFAYLEIYDAAGSYLGGSYLSYRDESVTHYYQADAGGVLYVAVTDDYYTSGSYVLTAEESVDPDTVPGDTSTTETLPVDGAVSNTIDYPYEADWFAVELAAGESYIFRLESDETSSEPLSDPYLILYDATGEYITENDDSDDGLNSRIDHVAEADGIIYASAQGYDMNTGDYILSVELI